MTTRTKQTIRNYIPFLSFLPAFYMVFVWGQFTENANSRMFKNYEQKENVLHHISNKDIHMPYSVKVKEFVPRTEIQTMKSDISEIKSDVKELLKK